MVHPPSVARFGTREVVWKKKRWEVDVSQKIGGFYPPKMDGENNGKPYEQMGWFGGTIIFGNTQLLFNWKSFISSFLLLVSKRSSC